MMESEQFAEADQLETTIRKNFPACHDERGAGREALGYGVRS
jgi:hypothetical protein